MSQKPTSSDLIPGPGFMIRMTFKRPSSDLIESFRGFETPDISDVLNRMYSMSAAIHNVTNDKMLLGSACTAKVFPGDNLMVHKALDIAQPGDIIIVDTCGNGQHAALGDLIANKAKHRGIAGFVVDGLIRDIPGIRQSGVPVYARGATPIGPLHRGPGEINYAISCDGIVVHPGDIIRADGNGVVVIPFEFAEDILARLQEQKQRGAQYITDVKQGVFSNAWVDAQLAWDNCKINK